MGDAATGWDDALVTLIPSSRAGPTVACAAEAGVALAATRAAAPAPYMGVPVVWTTPGESVIPLTVA